MLDWIEVWRPSQHLKLIVVLLKPLLNHFLFVAGCIILPKEATATREYHLHKTMLRQVTSTWMARPKFHNMLSSHSVSILKYGPLLQEFSSNPNQTHLSMLIRVFKIISLIKVGAKPSRERFEKPCHSASWCLVFPAHPCDVKENVINQTRPPSSIDPWF